MSDVPSWTKDRDEVRLFPSVHIHGEKEAELRAAASLLAAIRAVSEFGRKIVGLSDGIASKTARFSCYTEVTYKLRVAGKKPITLRPDGVIVVTRGKSKWVAFVEFKVGKATLEPEKIDDYQRLAKQEGVDALITVSNQAAHADDSPPVNIKLRRNLTLRHFSWERLLSEAQHLSEQKAISDPDQNGYWTNGYAMLMTMPRGSSSHLIWVPTGAKYSKPHRKIGSKSQKQTFEMWLGTGLDFCAKRRSNYVRSWALMLKFA